MKRRWKRTVGGWGARATLAMFAVLAMPAIACIAAIAAIAAKLEGSLDEWEFWLGWRARF